MNSADRNGNALKMNAKSGWGKSEIDFFILPESVH